MPKKSHPPLLCPSFDSIVIPDASENLIQIQGVSNDPTTVNRLEGRGSLGRELVGRGVGLVNQPRFRCSVAPTRLVHINGGFGVSQTPARPILNVKIVKPDCVVSLQYRTMEERTNAVYAGPGEDLTIKRRRNNQCATCKERVTCGWAGWCNKIERMRKIISQGCRRSLRAT